MHLQDAQIEIGLGQSIGQQGPQLGALGGAQVGHHGGFERREERLLGADHDVVLEVAPQPLAGVLRLASHRFGGGREMRRGARLVARAPECGAELKVELRELPLPARFQTNAPLSALDIRQLLALVLFRLNIRRTG